MYDDQLALQKRFDLLEHLEIKGDIEKNSNSAWALLQDPQALQGEMTRLVHGPGVGLTDIAVRGSNGRDYQSRPTPRRYSP